MSKILELAAQLPTGLDDPKALIKYHREYDELTEALAAGDTVGALLEAGDCYYYAHKAWHNDLVSEWKRNRLIKKAAKAVGYSVATVEAAAIAKYSLRARPGNPKDDAAEREAVKGLL